MIKINKLENVFGIKKLVGGGGLDKINVIYAPNGTAKSSIADALENISIGESVDDVYGSGLIPSYEIDVDGVKCDENNYFQFNIVKYSGVDEFELGNGEDYKGLVISNKMAGKVSSIQTNIKNSINNIENILLSCFKKKGKGKGEPFSKSLKEAIGIIAGPSKNDDALIINFVKNLQFALKPLATTIDEEKFYKLVNIKASEAANKPEIKQNLNEYASIIKKNVLSNILDEKFGINKLNDFSNHITQDNYFDSDGKRKLFINNEEIGQKEFDNIVKNENDLVFGSEETKSKFNECKNALEKNKVISSFANALLSDPNLLSHASDYNTFVNELFITLIDAKSLNAIEAEKNSIVAEQSKLESMKSSFDDSDNVITKIWNDFKSRFTFEKFDLDIKNKFDAVIGFEVPSFVKCIKGTNDEITDPRELRFSTGEIKSFNLINAIIEVERMRLIGDKFTILLDDAVDSFDYKNKYGIIDYLVDISSDTNIQFIIFTHNFDFYRSTILALGKTNVNQYFMYKDSNKIVTLYNSNSEKYYLEISKFNDWKKAHVNAKYFALIPFFRSVIQLESNSKNSDVLILDSYLHYDDSISPSLDLNGLDGVLSSRDCELPSCLSLSDKYLECIEREATSIITQTIRETDLEKKLVLGLYIRIFSERLLCKLIISHGLSIPSINSYNRTKDLMNFAVANNCVSDDEKNLLIEANLIAPSYVHANSFMYEPLIDVDSSPLKDLATRLKNKNSVWPL